MTDQDSSQLDQLHVRVSALETSLAANTEATNRTEANTSEIVEFLGSIKGAMRVLDWIGMLAKPIAYITMAATAIWGAWLAIKTGTGIHPK